MYALCRMVTLPMTLTAASALTTSSTPFSAFCTIIHSFIITGASRYFKFGIYSLTIASPTLPMKYYPWKGRGQGHVSNFYILDLENVATASRRCIGVVNKSRRRSACGLYLRRSSASWLNAQVYFTLVTLYNSITSICSAHVIHCTRSYTVLQQLARFWPTYIVIASSGVSARCSEGPP